MLCDSCGAQRFKDLGIRQLVAISGNLIKIHREYKNIS